MDISSGQLIWMISAAIGIMALLALLLVIFYMATRRRILQENLVQQELKIAHQLALNKQSLQTQEDERRRIAKDLHDDVGSKLNVSLLYLHQLEKQLDSQTKGPQILEDTRDLLNGIITTTRNISHDLLPPTIESLGIWVAIQELGMEVNGSGQAHLDLHLIASELPEIPGSQGIHLYRALQELIKNSITHGDADSLKLEIRMGDSGIEIDYSDNGKGFDTKLPNISGLGMSSIEHRLLVLDLNIRYESAIGSGTKAYIRRITN
ncbi:MAG: hypothetical protein KDC34_13720 [Saprospiraceae bacterium]|nr:hypothetical protein [Saprospiraceae bacterium]